MSAFAGWFGSPADDPELLSRVARHLKFSPDAVVRTVTAQNAAIHVVGPEDAACIYQVEQRIGAICGRFWWSDSEVAAVARERGNGPALALAFDRLGARLLESLSGEFCVAFYDASHGQGLIATDRKGVLPVYHAPLAGGVAFGATADALREHPEVKSAPVDAQSIFNYLYFHHVPGPQTAFVGCRRLLPGSALRASPDRGWAEEIYWRPAYAPGAPRVTRELEAEFLQVVESSVLRFGDNSGAGAFLSGGTDSSTVAGMMTRGSQPVTKTFSIGFDEPGYDEMEFARIASGHFGTEQHEYYVTPQDVVDVAPTIAAVYSEPFGNASAVPTYYCAKMGRETGVSLMLGGDGGDELFGGNAQYARQYLFSFYDRLPGALRRSLIEPLLCNRVAAALPGISKLSSYVEQAAVPLPARLYTYNQIERLGLDTLFTQDFLSRIDVMQPAAIREAEYAAADANHWLNKILARDLKSILADTDLPKVGRMSAAAGQEVYFPLLSDELMDFASRLHPKLKVRRTTLRFFFKQALRDFLPREVIEKKKHGFGLPIGPWLAQSSPVRDFASDTLADFRKRGIVEPKWIDTIFDDHLRRYPHYYGTVIWLFLILELWLARRGLSL